MDDGKLEVMTMGELAVYMGQEALEVMHDIGNITARRLFHKLHVPHQFKRLYLS